MQYLGQFCVGLIIAVASIAIVQSTCVEVTSLTPSYPADYSQHVLQAGEDNWLMCSGTTKDGKQIAINSFQVRTDYAQLLAAEWLETYLATAGAPTYVPLAIAEAVGAIVAGALIACGCTTDNCLASTSLYLSALPAVANGFPAPWTAVSQELAAALGASASSLAAQFPGLPQEFGSATGVVIPYLNSTSHASFETSTLVANTDFTIYQIPGIPARLNGANFAYNEGQNTDESNKFSLLFNAIDWSGNPISGALQLDNGFGPLLWGPNNNGFFNVPLPDGTVQGWTQTDQPWMPATGIVNAFGASVEFTGGCWNSRQRSTHPLTSSPAVTTPPYVWVPVVVLSDVVKFVAQFATYYADYTYSTALDISGNIAHVICEGDRNYDPLSAIHTVKISGKKCYAGQMQALTAADFAFTLSDPVLSLHGSGLTYWQTVKINAPALGIVATAQTLVIDNEYDWKTDISTAYSEAPCVITGKYNNKAFTGNLCSIEHLKTG